MTTIYTIGHSTHPLEHFENLLRRHDISTLVDVRSQPYSKWAPHFKREPLSRSLASAGFVYVFLGHRLGGKPQAEEFYDAEGHVDYARRAQAPDFQVGIEELLRIGGASPTAVMCAEEKPDCCHRRLLVTPALEIRDVVVAHIRGDGRLDLEADLGPSSTQLPLFA